MDRVIIYGAGGTGRRILKENRDQFSIICFVDIDKNKQGMIIDGILCKSLEDALKLDYDKVIVGAASGKTEIVETLQAKGVPKEKICEDFVESRTMARLVFLENYSKICGFKQNNNICVAEAGVFRGEFAKDINRLFPENKLYLYDTFEGFSPNDVNDEELKSDVMKKREEMVGHFSSTSEEIVLSRMIKPGNCIIRKGYFPYSFLESDKQFGFVSLDMDLYEPMLAGMKVFYPLLCEGGVILVDDYFTPGHPKVQNAIEDYEKQNNFRLSKVPIGDGIGIAIIKPFK